MHDEDSSPKRASFDDFYARQRDGAVKLAWLLTRDASASQDVTQSAFLSVFERFDQIDNPTAYLRTSILNEVRSRARSSGRRDRRQRLSVVGASMTSPAPSDPMIDVLSELSERQRTVLVLRYWADLADAEIADLLGLRPASVRSLAHRGLKQLERKMPR